MDFISGCSLLDFRQQAQQDFDGIPYAEILFIAKNITAGLDYAHRLKDAKTGAPLHLVHRDISPHNIMISREGDIKIIDFGVAKTNESQDRSFHSEEAGKLRYMSPEQVSFGDEVTQSSDIYSMGVTLWELVAGVRVYEGLSQAQILDAIRTQDLPDLRQYRFDCPDYLMQVIKKATHRDPQQRYKTASDFHKEVSFLLNTHFASYTQEDFRMKVEWALKPTIEAETAQLANLEQAQNINNGRLKIKDRTKTLFRSPYFVINPRYLYYLLFATAMYAVHYHQENKTIDWAESSVNLMTELRQFLHTGNKPKALPKAYAKRRDVAKQTISINTSPAGAKILINDKEYDETPATIDLPEGVQSRIVLRLEGYKDEHVTLNPNMTRVFFRLTPAN